MENSRLFVIGLDAADKNLIESWASTGDLPAFRSIIDTAVKGDIENPQDLQDSAVVRALATRGDADLWTAVGGAKHIPLEAVREWFRRAPGPERNPERLLEELRPFLEKRSKP